MLTFAIEPNSFALGFVFGTSVYVAASSAGYLLFHGVRRIFMWIWR
jgi:hypothetical protein